MTAKKPTPRARPPATMNTDRRPDIIMRGMMTTDDPWRDYWRASTAGLLAVIMAAGGAIGWGVLTQQAAMALSIVQIETRGKENADNIKEIKDALKQAKDQIALAHDAIVRLEAKTP